MAAVLAFLGSRLGLWLIASVLVAAFVAGLHHKVKQSGWDEREAIAVKEEKARQEAQARADARWTAALTAYRDELDAKLAEAAKKQRALEERARVLYVQLKERMPDYVTPTADARIAACGGIPVGFVRHHDAAAAGPAAGPIPPAPERGVVDADSGVALSAVSQTVADNYAKFHRCITALQAWESWYPDVRAVYERRLAPPPSDAPQ